MGEEASFEGGCTCRQIRYRMRSSPMFVHCCHCHWCQRETGTAFALNALIETQFVNLTSGSVEVIDTPTLSGKGQKISRCPRCRVAVWSTYAGGGETLRFVRVGTLDDASAFSPSIHIFTASKLPWVRLPDDVPAVPEYYQASKYWPAASLDRRAVLRAAPTPS